TGMGLERTAAVVNGKTSVYETDLLAPLLERVAELVGIKYGSDDAIDNAIRVVAEHSRGITFLIADGVMPSNEGRGYVLRRLLRRAALFGRRLGLDKPFLAEIAETTIEQMGHIYPEIVDRRDFALKVIEGEEARFSETLSTGIVLLEGILDEIREVLSTLPHREQRVLQLRWGVDDGRSLALGEVAQKFEVTVERIRQIEARALRKLRHPSRHRRLEKMLGEEAFKLYDTYGFPLELTKEIIAKSGFSVYLERL
ncbi:unnamed protein product, partial [marine sediment metagenome]